ncbi:hypothetical protein H0N96_01420, partial [Candidatus Micrarchaeota archaeon]|nr:hypothetical protein [Candidatus Micrarchaeota archaeon]
LLVTPRIEYRCTKQGSTPVTGKFLILALKTEWEHFYSLSKFRTCRDGTVEMRLADPDGILAAKEVGTPYHQCGK